MTRGEIPFGFASKVLTMGFLLYLPFILPNL